MSKRAAATPISRRRRGYSFRSAGAALSAATTALAHLLMLANRAIPAPAREIVSNLAPRRQSTKLRGTDTGLAKPSKSRRDFAEDVETSIKAARECEDPDLRAHLLLHCASALHDAWRLPEALALTEESLATRSTPKALKLRAELLCRLGHFDEAKQALRRMLDDDPLSVFATRQLRFMETESSSCPEARLAQLKEHISKSEDRTRTALRAVGILIVESIFDGAIEIAEGALADLESRRSPSELREELLLKLGHAHELKGNFLAAIEIYSAIDIESHCFKKAMLNAARCHLELGQLTEADRAARRVHTADLSGCEYDVTCFNIRVAQGRFVEAFRGYRHRPVTRALPKVLGNRYSADFTFASEQHKAASCLLLSEGGPGDEIRWASLYNELSDRFGSLTITCDPRLESILKRSFPHISFLPASRIQSTTTSSTYDDRDRISNIQAAALLTNAALDKAEGMDVVRPIADALMDLRPTRTSFRRLRPYLIPDPTQCAKWKSFIRETSGQADVFRVAISWRSLLHTMKRDKHYIRAGDLAVLRCIQNAEFWIMQPSASEAEIDLLRSSLPRVFFPEGLDLRDDFEAQAGFIANMDLVIAPFTTAAELAGALGARAIFFSSSRTTSWRKNTDGSDLWHPTAEIVTGSPIGHKASLLTNLTRSLESHCVAHHASWNASRAPGKEGRLPRVNS